MNIFEKRPLCLMLCIGLCGFLLFTFESTILKIGIISIGIILFVLSFFLKNADKSGLKCRIAAVMILVSALLSFLYFDIYFKADKVYGSNEVEIVGTVEAVSESSSYTNRLLVKAETVNGKPSAYRFYAYPTKAESKGIIEGTKIRFTATVGGFSNESYTYNISKGINGYANDISDLTILDYTDGGLTVMFGRIREYLTRYTISLSDGKSGAILSALLLGERDYLPDQLRLDFKRIGISHILALSGMHLAIISLGIGKLLTLLHIKKKARLAIISIFVIIYMAITGFSVSVVRAGLMLIISSVLFLLSKSKDSLTSLSVAVLIICLITPYAIMDISLWLSALATFGIIAFSEFSSTLPKPQTKKTAILRYFSLAILASVFAISATIAISTISFGGFSILAPLTTIIFSFLSEIIMYLGCIMLLIGWLIPIGWLVSPLCSLMTWLSGVFSSIKLAYVSSYFDIAIIVILIYTLAFYLFLVLKLKKPGKALNVLIIFHLVVNVIPVVGTVSESYKESVIYCSDTRCDLMVVRSENQVCLINSSQYNKNLVYTALDLLEEAKATTVDKYYLTHYSWSIDDDIEALLYNISVDKIYLPAPQNKDEETILKLAKKSVEGHRTEIVVFQSYETVYVGNYTINLLHSEPYGNSSMNAYCVANGDEVFTYISSGLLDGNSRERFLEYMTLSDHIILGEHGKKYKNKIYITECYEDLDSIIVNSQNVFLTQDNLQYFTEKGCIVVSHPTDFIHLK